MCAHSRAAAGAALLPLLACVAGAAAGVGALHAPLACGPLCRRRAGHAQRHCDCLPTQVDVWSMGVIYYQMLFGRRPFGEGMTQEALARQGVLLNASQVRGSPGSRPWPGAVCGLAPCSQCRCPTAPQLGAGWGARLGAKGGCCWAPQPSGQGRAPTPARPSLPLRPALPHPAPAPPPAHAPGGVPRQARAEPRGPRVHPALPGPAAGGALGRADGGAGPLPHGCPDGNEEELTPAAIDTLAGVQECIAAVRQSAAAGAAWDRRRQCVGSRMQRGRVRLACTLQLRLDK